MSVNGWPTWLLGAPQFTAAMQQANEAAEQSAQNYWRNAAREAAHRIQPGVYWQSRGKTHHVTIVRS